MSIRGTRTQDLKRAANLPDDVLVTICGWGRLQSDDNEFGSLVMLDNGAAAGPSQYCGLEIQADGVELRVIGSGGTGVTLATLAVGTDFYWAFRSSGTGVNETNGLYRVATANTLTVANMGTRGAVTPSQLTVFGSGFGDNFGERFNGRIWSVKCWDRVLTDKELLIESYYRRVMFPTSLNFNWRLRNISDTRDYSGNGRTPTVTGTFTTEGEGRPLWSARENVMIPNAAAVAPGGAARKRYGIRVGGMMGQGSIQ